MDEVPEATGFHELPLPANSDLFLRHLQAEAYDAKYALLTAAPGHAGMLRKISRNVQKDAVWGAFIAACVHPGGQELVNLCRAQSLRRPQAEPSRRNEAHRLFHLKSCCVSGVSASHHSRRLFQGEHPVSPVDGRRCRVQSPEGGAPIQPAPERPPPPYPLRDRRAVVENPAEAEFRQRNRPQRGRGESPGGAWRRAIPLDG
jgi:hypothetical protein